MNYQDKTKDELINDLLDLQRKYASVSLLYDTEKSALASLVENNSDVILVKDCNRRIIAGNSAFLYATGNSSLAELIGKTDAEILNMPENAEPVFSYMQEDLKALQLPAGKIIEREEYIPLPNGELKTFLTKKFPIFTNGELIGIGVITSDITKRKRAEQSVLEAKQKAEESDAFIQAIIENSNNNIFAVNTNYELIYINQNFKDEFYTSFGVHLQIGDLVVNCLPEPLQPIWKGYYDRAFNNEYFTFEEKVETTHNNIVYIHVSFSPIFLNNKIIGASIFASNITERKQVEEELLKAKERAEEIAENYRISEFDLKKAQSIAHLGNWKWDLKTSEVTWSDEMYQIFGIEKKTYTGRLGDVIAKVIHPDDLHIVLPSNAPEIAEKKPIEYRIIMPDKSIRYILAEAGETVFDNNGNPLFLTGIAQDITERKLTEFELIKNKEKAEESDRLKTAFLENMSHEIRTPMNAICGFSGLLNNPDLSDEKRKSFVSIIQNSSHQLLSIVTDILTISSIETKQEKPNISKVCINNIIVDLLSVFKQQSINQNISLYAKKELTDIQSEIFTDKTKVTQILTNLLTNSLKFTHDGFIEFGYILKETELEFYVKDSGIGIKSELYEKIFERFRQADKSIQMNYGGTGLGLSISKGFVELLGGKIWVQSKPTKGATFYFTIPYKPVNEINITTSPTKQNGNFRTVLVAEDEEYNFLLIEEYLTKTELKLIHAKDGKETVEICKANPNIDLILMDIKMPIMTGDTAAKLIKEFRPDLPIIAQSGYALEHELKKYSGIFDDYLTKPIKETALKQKVMKYIEIQNIAV